MSDTSFPIKDPDMLVVLLDGMLDEQTEIDQALDNQLEALEDRPIDSGLGFDQSDMIERLQNIRRYNAQTRKTVQGHIARLSKLAATKT